MRLLQAHRYEGGWWFRIFGIGLYAKDIRRHPLLFSERNGYRRYIRLGAWVIGILRRPR